MTTTKKSFSAMAMVTKKVNDQQVNANVKASYFFLPELKDDSAKNVSIESVCFFNKVNGC